MEAYMPWIILAVAVAAVLISNCKIVPQANQFILQRSVIAAQLLHKGRRG